jgi:hypothetical protein
VQAVGEQWEKDHHAQRSGTDSISSLLQQTIDVLLPDGGTRAAGMQPRVIVFIDDLDRCNPDAAFKLLEGIKVYLNIPKCVFVIAMNETAMQEAIAKNLPSLDKEENHLRSGYARRTILKSSAPTFIACLNRPSRTNYSFRF